MRSCVSLQSMTGFARHSDHYADYGWSWEIRSVNAKGMDCRLRIPAGFESLDAGARAACVGMFKRGNISATLTVKETGPQGRYRLNQALLDQVIQTTSQLKKVVPDYQPISLDGLLTIRGVMEPVEETELADETRKALEKAILASFQTGLVQLQQARGAEGTRLETILHAQLNDIATEVAAAQACAESQPEAIQARLRRQLSLLLQDTDSLDEDRLYQEAALLMTKADVREELDRLRAHGEQGLALLTQGSPCGRKLDFLCQEFNREANTLCSKSQDVTLTRHGMTLKTIIEQFREQVQNIE